MKQCKWKTLTIIFLLSISFLLIGLYKLSQTLDTLTAKDVYKLQLSFSKAKFVQIIKQWQELKLIDNYYNSFKYDFIFLIGYSLTLYVLIIILSCIKRLKIKRFLIYLPLIAGIMDITENFLEISILNDYNFNSYLILLQSFAALIKFLAVFFSIAPVIWLIIQKRKTH